MNYLINYTIISKNVYVHTFQKMILLIETYNQIGMKKSVIDLKNNSECIILN